MILHLIEPHASLLSFFLHEFHHLMSRRPPEVPHNLRRFFASKTRALAASRQFGTSPAAARPSVSWDPSGFMARSIRHNAHEPLTLPISFSHFTGFSCIVREWILEFDRSEQRVWIRAAWWVTECA
jgi:hypothetical protein